MEIFSLCCVAAQWKNTTPTLMLPVPFCYNPADEERKLYIASRAKMHTVLIPVGACFLCYLRFLLGRIPKTPLRKNEQICTKNALRLSFVVLYLVYERW